MRSLCGNILVACLITASTFFRPCEAEVSYTFNRLYEKEVDMHVYGIWMDTVNDDLYSGRFYSVERYDGSTHTIVAGKAENTGPKPVNGSPATGNRLYVPAALARDNNGNMFITLNMDYLICKTDADGIIYRVAGSGSYGNTLNGDGGKATSAHLGPPVGMALDASGNIYFAVDGSSTIANIRKVTPEGIISTFIAYDSTNGDTGDGGSYTVATMAKSYSHYIFNNKFYFTTKGCRARVVDFASGFISTVAGGSCDAGNAGLGDVQATSAKLSDMSPITVDTNGVIYMYDAYVIRKVANGVSRVIAGYGGFGNPDNNTPALQTGLPFGYWSSGITTDTTGNVYFAMRDHSVVAKLTLKVPTMPPTEMPTIAPSAVPSVTPSVEPTATPTVVPTLEPSETPTVAPSAVPTVVPSPAPSAVPTLSPTEAPSVAPTDSPTETPTLAPTAEPTAAPTVAPSEAPTAAPTDSPTVTPTVAPSAAPTLVPTTAPSEVPTLAPSEVPTVVPSAAPTTAPSFTPSAEPSVMPTVVPTAVPTTNPTLVPTVVPTITPSVVPTVIPTRRPSVVPTFEPTALPTEWFAGVEIDASLEIEDVELERPDDDYYFAQAGRRLARAGSMVLSEVSDQAIIATVANLLSLSEHAVTIKSENVTTDGTTNITTVHVKLAILAPARDYPVSGQHFKSYDACFTYFSNKFSTAVDTQDMYNQLLVVAANTGAHELYNATAVTATSVSNQGVVDTRPPSPDDADLSDQELGGVVIGIVLASLVIIALVYFCVSRKVKSETNTGGVSGGASDATRVVVAVTEEVV